MNQNVGYGFSFRNNENETDARKIIVSMVMQIIQCKIGQEILMICTHSNS